jgi:Cu/Ag efflux pump CusA
MIRSIVATSLRFRLLMVALAAGLLGVGAAQLREMPVDVLPEFAPTTVEIQTEALGLSATEVEQLITVPIEQDLLVGVAFLDDIRSQSVAGLSRVLLVFEPGTDLFTARQVVAERLTQAHALPHVSKPPQMLQPLSSTNRVMMVGVSSKDVSPIEMSVQARWTIAPRLTGVPGVANVSIWGQRDRQLQVQVDPEHLRDQNVSLLQVLETAGNALWVSPLTFVEASTPGTGGFIDTPNQRLGVQHLLPISTPEDLAKVRLQETEKLTLGDVATVVEDHQPLIGDAVLGSGGGGGLLFVIEKLPEANTLAVTRGVEDAIREMQPGFTGLDFDTTVYRPASYIEQAGDNIRMALLFAAGLLILALVALFLRWRTVVVAMAAIAVSLVSAALVVWALGETMNVMVFAGLVAALLLVIDDAIVDVDAISSRLRREREEGSERSTAEIILEATLHLRSSAVYAGLIMVLAALPVLFLDGVAGAFFPSMVVAFVAALATSMAVALLLTPALYLLLLPNGQRERGDSVFMRWLRGGYERLIGRSIRRPGTAYAVAGGLVIAAFASMPFLDQSLLPKIKETELLIRWDGTPGTSLPEMKRITARATGELRAVEGVRNVGAHVGRAVTADQVVGVNSGEIWVSIDPKADYDKTLKSVENVAAGYPGMSRDVRPFSSERVDEVLSGNEDDVVVRLYGEDLQVLGTKAREVQRTIAGVDGISNERVQFHTNEPTLVIEPNLAAAQRHGIKPGDIRRAAATLLSGIAVGSLFEEQKVFDVVVWGTPDTRNSVNAIKQLLIDTPEGDHVRLSDVADVRIAPNPSVIRRQGVSRYVDVTAHVDSRGGLFRYWAMGSATKDVERALENVKFPLEFHAEVLASSRQPIGRFAAIALAAAIGIFLLLQAAFGSWRLGAATFFAAPVALTGGLLAALIGGGTLSFGSYAGLLAVLGLTARNGMALMSHYRRLEREEGMEFGPDLIVRGAQERFPAIFSSAVAAAIVVLPAVAAGPIPGFEVIQPLAIVVLGGLITSIFINLFVAPAVYLRYGYSPAPEPVAPMTPAPQAGK